MANEVMHRARANKNDEFYTRYEDVAAQMNDILAYDPHFFHGKTVLCPCDDPEKSSFAKYFADRFEDLGLGRLICTCYAGHEKEADGQPARGRCKIRTAPGAHRNGFMNPPADTDEVYETDLQGNGDFRSMEVTAFRNEADLIITNPPFSLFLEFLQWCRESDASYLLIGHQNSMICKEIFPLISCGQLRLGHHFPGNAAYFHSPYEDTAVSELRKDGLIRVPGIVWYTDISYGQEPSLQGMRTMEENLQENSRLRSKLKRSYGTDHYPRYQNYDALEVPMVNAIPRDYLPCWISCRNAGTCPYALTLGDHTATALCEEGSRAGQTPVCSYEEEVQSGQFTFMFRMEEKALPVTSPRCNGVMGVPVTYLLQHDPTRIEILGCTQRGCHDAFPDLKRYDTYREFRADGTPTGHSGCKANESAMLTAMDGTHNYFRDNSGDTVQAAYGRVFIRWKQAEKVEKQ